MILYIPYIKFDMLVFYAPNGDEINDIRRKVGLYLQSIMDKNKDPMFKVDSKASVYSLIKSVEKDDSQMSYKVTLKI